MVVMIRHHCTDKFNGEGMRFIRYLANGITTSRIIASIMILFTVPFSFVFFLLYTFAGITDMVDGTIARKTHTESKEGAILDSSADIVFLIAILFKLSPILINTFPQWILWATIIIGLIRIGAYMIGVLKFHKFVALHTISNKITGAVLFCVPYFILVADINVIGIFLCILAGISAVEELMIDIIAKQYNPDIRSIFEFNPRL